MTPTHFPPNHPSLVWSPGNVFFDGGTAIVTMNSTYLKAGFTGSSFAFSIDVARYQENKIAHEGWGQWVVSVNGSAPRPVIVPEPAAGSSVVTVTLAEGLDAKEKHGLQVWFDLHDETDTYFVPKNAQVIKSIVLDAGAELFAPTGLYQQLPEKMMILGDSITKGYRVTDPSGLSNSENYPLATYAATVGQALNCEYGIVGKSAQGWVSNANEGNVLFPVAFPNYLDGKPRVWPSGLKYLVVAQGTNDWQDVTGAVEAWLPEARKAVGTATWIIMVVPFMGTHKEEIQAAVAAYRSTSRDAKVAVIVPIDVLKDARSFLYTMDTVHPNPLYHPVYGAVAASQIAQVTKA